MNTNLNAYMSLGRCPLRRNPLDTNTSFYDKQFLCKFCWRKTMLFHKFLKTCTIYNLFILMLDFCGCLVLLQWPVKLCFLVINYFSYFYSPFFHLMTSPITTLHLTSSRFTTPHPTTHHHFISHHITSHPTTHHHFTSHHTSPPHIPTHITTTSHHTSPLHIPPHITTSHPTTHPLHAHADSKRTFAKKFLQGHILYEFSCLH